MEIYVTKPTIPILWLDTSIIIGITKARQGEAIQEAARLLRFDDVVYRKVHEQKLICPEGDQEEEFELGKRLIDECHRTQARLAWSIQFEHRERIRRKQMYRVMRAHVNGETSLEMSYLDAFFEDPIEALAKQVDLRVTVNFQSSDDWIDFGKSKKQALREHLEKLRQAHKAAGNTYNQVLENEYTGLIQVARFTSRHLLEGVPLIEGMVPGDINAQMMNIGEALAAWDSFGGQPKGIEGVINFWGSDDYKSTPQVEISCKLFAKIETSDVTIESGDSMDIDQIAALMPYCNYLITDRKMKSRLVDLGFDVQYACAVYSGRDLDGLADILEKL